MQLKKMSGQIVQVRLNRNQVKPLQGCEQHYFNLFKIDAISYSFKNGIDLLGSQFIL
jgi:hypothetical protein